MYGRRLAGVLIAVAVGSAALCGITIYIWRVIKRRRRGQEDTESLKPVPRSQCDDCRFDFILPDPPAQVEIWVALRAFRDTVTTIGQQCQRVTKDPPQLSDSQLQAHLDVLGVAKDRLPSHKLLELLPLRVGAFINHLISTTLISAITLNENASRTILHAQLVALYESIPPCPNNIDGPEWNRIAARCREFLAYLLRAHELDQIAFNQKGVDQLMCQLTDILGSILGPAVINSKEFQPNLLDAVRAAVDLGTYLLRHPADHRFDWTTSLPSDGEPVVIFPGLFRATDNRGLPIRKPVLVDLGWVKCVGSRIHTAYPDASAWAVARPEYEREAC